MNTNTAPDITADTAPGTGSGVSGVRWWGRVRPAWTGILLLGLVTWYFVGTQSSFNVYIYNSILFACLGAIALQVLMGTTGLVSIGNAAFLILGSFGAVFAHRAGIEFPFNVAFAALLCGVVGFITGIPAMRLRSLFLALATLATYYIVVFAATFYQSKVPEAQYSGFSVPVLFASKGIQGGGHYWSWLLYGVVSLLVLAASRLMSERSGRAMRMIREHEYIAPTLGIAVSRYKLGLFTASSVIIGIQGALTVHFVGIVSTDTFTLLVSFQYVAMITIGGRDSILGCFLGATVVIGLASWVPKFLNDTSDGRIDAIVASNLALIIYGLLVIIFVTSSPDGLVGTLRNIQHKTLTKLRKHPHHATTPTTTPTTTTVALFSADGEVRTADDPEPELAAVGDEASTPAAP